LNRTTALFVALAILLGHALAIHKNAAGELAPPYDMAFVAYRIGRNFAQTGELSWASGVLGIESYPSLLWIGVSAIFERLYWPVHRMTQSLGMVSALLCVLTLSQFSPVRLAGVIAPLLFVVSGSIAAAALSGMETASLALLVTFSFLAYERGWRFSLGVALGLAAIARPQGLVFALALAAIELARRGWDLLRRTESPRPKLWLPLAVPVALSIVTSGLRYHATGHWTSTWASQLMEFRPRLVLEGLNYLRDFAVTSGSGALFVFPLWYWVRGSLSGVGIRACVLTLAWSAAIALGGGGFLPYSEALAPIVAVLLVAVQEAMQIALDSKRRGWPQATWFLFLAGLAASVLGSKFPGDIGPLRVEAAHRAWMKPHTAARYGYTEDLGRVGLAEEILATERLREIGLFLRDNIDAGHTVLTPWPGAISYLSQRKISDPLGRTSPSPGEARTRAWEGFARADVLKALSVGPEYILPSLRFGDTSPTAQEIAYEWVQSLDLLREKQQRAMNLRSRMSDYELITVPVVGSGSRAGIFPRNHFRLMRRVDLELTPNVSIHVDGARFAVDVAHRSYPQLVDLRVQAIDAKGQRWNLRPNGEWSRLTSVVARSTVMLFHTGERSIRLVEAPLPEGGGPFELRAVLRNPGATGESVFCSCSSEALAVASGR
jgi:hypothetical protein